MTTSRARLRSIGAYIPPTRVSNLERLSDLNIEESFLRNRIGVTARALKDPDEGVTHMCVKAFKNLIEHCPLDTSTVDIACVVTQNPDMPIPHAAARVHEALALPRHCMTFDISQGCAGYAHGVAVITALLDQLGFANALLFTCDPYSKIVDQDNRDTALLFGDAATATLFSASGAGYRLVGSNFGTALGSSSCLQCSRHLEMNGQDVFSHAMRNVPSSIVSVLQSCGIATSEIDVVLLHQGTRYMVQQLAQALKIPPEKACYEAGNYGNTVSSSIPIMLQKHLQCYGPKRILFSGFGVGFSWGTCLLERCSH